MNSHTVEALVGTLVIAVAAAFLYYAYANVNGTRTDGVRIVANFDRADGISVGTDVRISGVKIGSVVDKQLDPKTYLAHVVMSVDPTVKIPDDSSVKVAVDGLLGGNYLAVVPGGSATILAAGGEITNTQPSIDIVGLLGQAIFSPSSSGHSNNGNSGDGAAQPGTSQP